MTSDTGTGTDTGTAGRGASGPVTEELDAVVLGAGVAGLYQPLRLVEPADSV